MLGKGLQHLAAAFNQERAARIGNYPREGSVEVEDKPGARRVTSKKTNKLFDVDVLMLNGRLHLSSIGGVSDPDLVEAARAEARAIVSEAEEQARRLMEAAEARRRDTDEHSDEIRREGRELARNLERSIQLLSQILEELKRQIG